MNNVFVFLILPGCLPRFMGKLNGDNWNECLWDVFPVEGRRVCPCILLRTVSIVVFKIVCVFVYLVLLMLTVEAQRTWKLFPECLNNKIYKEVWHSITLVSLFSCSLVFKVFTILREEDWNWVCGKPFVLGVSDVFWGGVYITRCADEMFQALFNLMKSIKTILKRLLNVSSSCSLTYCPYCISFINTVSQWLWYQISTSNKKIKASKKIFKQCLTWCNTYTI